MAKLEYLVGPSDGDDWIAFGEAAWRIEGRLNVSVGHSQVTLRNLCASGEVRSVRIEYDIDPSDDPDATPVEVKMVRPSEWRTTEVDLDGVIEVSEGDLEYWLREQGAPPPPVIERQLMPQPQWKQALVRKAIAELWPNDIPEELVNAQIEQRVCEHLKRMGAPPISGDTILRAAAGSRHRWHCPHMPPITQRPPSAVCGATRRSVRQDVASDGELSVGTMPGMQGLLSARRRPSE